MSELLGSRHSAFAPSEDPAVLVSQLCAALEALYIVSPEETYMIAGRLLDDMNEGSDSAPRLNPNLRCHFISLAAERLDVIVPATVDLESVYVGVHAYIFSVVNASG